MRNRLSSLLVPAVWLAASLGWPAAAQDAGTPWWQEQKIVFAWGQWAHAREDKSQGFWGEDPRSATLPRELFRNLDLAGVTVFTEIRWYNSENARFAHEFGLKYFATVFVCDLSGKRHERSWLKRDEEHWWPCPLDPVPYERWVVEPHLEGVRAGLIDGIQFDWEAYGGRGEAGICYCDHCFGAFPGFRATGEGLPAKLERYGWLEENGLVSDYESNFSVQRVALFTRIRKTLQAAKPDLLFSSYGTVFSDFTRAVNTPEAPFVFLDCRHYYNDDRQPWWESYGPRLKQEGYLYIPGGWTNALFGAQASQVSAAQWIYEAAINEDGCWLWFERELDDEILRAYAGADRQITTAEEAVGDFLFRGRRDPNFVTAVEWTGRPELQQAVLARTYHLEDTHLAHVSNVDTEWPVRVRLRFPRLTGAASWTAQDALGELYYSRDNRSPVWTTAELQAGVVVALEPRSDLFLRVAPASANLAVDQARLLRSREFSVLAEPAVAAATAGPIKTIMNLHVLRNSIYDAALDELLSTTEAVFTLPKTGWLFRWDKEDIGPSAGWFRPETAVGDWEPIEIERFWGSQGSSGGPGWYRAEVDIPELPAGRRVYLHFGAVDETLVLWIDGVYAGDHKHPRGPGYSWDKPSAIDVTGKLTGGRHLLVFRVWNIGGAGGVWKPVRVLTGPDTGAATAGTAGSRPGLGSAGPLLYTATEPMGFEGPEAPMTIGNTIRVLDEEKQTRLRQVRGHLWSPSYSPDGTRIAFVHDAGGLGQVFVMNADGSNAVNLSANRFCDRAPVWAPDGAGIAFLSDRGGDWDIWLMNADGSGQRRLAGNPGLDRAVVWAPDGSRIAWESHVSGIPSIWICDADGSGSRPLLAPDRPLTIQQLQAGADQVFNFAEVDNVFPDNTFYLTDPVWSADGRQLAATGLGSHSGRVVVVLDADGSRMLQVIGWIGGVAQLAWSPDGTQLAGTLRTAPQETERSGVFVVNADGTDKYRWLVDVTPQGPRLGGARRHGLMSWYSHGSAQPRRAVKTFASLTWAPDGESLAFSSDMDSSGAFCVYTIPVAGGEPTKLDLTDSAWPNHIMWRPRQPE